MGEIAKRAEFPQFFGREVLMGEDYVNLLRRPLYELGISVTALPNNPAVSPHLRSHADLMAFNCGNGKLVLSKGVISPMLVNYLTNRGLAVIEARREQKPSYPHDVGLCAALVGKYFLHNLRHTDEAILENLGGEIIPVQINQGYARCSICAVDDNSIMTFDRGVGRAARQAGIDVLLLNEFEIRLNGFRNGFLGGSAFKLPNKSLAFTGQITNSLARAEIEVFLSERGIVPEYLSERPIFDIGGAVTL